MLNLFKNEILAHTAIYKNETSYNQDNNFEELYSLMQKYPNFSTFDAHNPHASVKQILNENYDSNIKDYSSFINTLEVIFNKNFKNIRSKQINIFTTNYDLLLEDCITKNNRVILNDGFGKNSNYTNNIELNSANYFKSVYSNGSFYNYRSEDFTVNLFKLHGSLNWEAIYW